MTFHRNADVHALGDTPEPALIVRSPPARLTAQRGLFAGPSALVSDDLYATVTRGVAQRRRAGVFLHPNATVSTNTYFGRFPASYWQRWTAVSEVRVHAQVAGSGRISVVASDSLGRPRTVAVSDVTDGQEVHLTVGIDRFLDGGALWLEITSGVDPLTVSGVRWTVEPPEKIRPAAVVICTFNRADDCATTLAALTADADAIADVDAVYVVDQGTDRVDTREKYRQLATQLGDKLVYLTQPNLGGAGGFTRGLYEVADVVGAHHANVIFMDDDVLCEPEVLIRLSAFANRTVEPAIVGAQMLHLLHPDRLHLSAEYADLHMLQAGIATPKALVDSDMTVHNQERRVDASYNGWWTCLIPAEIVASVGYPLPLFFQWDDIEYGYRARAAGHATVTLPGAGLWHADFAWKDWDEWHRYFNIRNALITAALHSEFGGKRIAQNLMRRIALSIAGMQYGLALTLIMAAEDFLVGPAILRDGGVEAADAVRRERAKFGETRRHPASSVPGLRAADASIHTAAPPPSRSGLVLGKRIVNQLRGRTTKAPVAIPSVDAHWWHVSKFDTAVVTDASQEGVRVRKRDVAAMRELSVRASRVCLRLVREGADVTQQYRHAMPELTSRENWTRLFGKS